MLLKRTEREAAAGAAAGEERSGVEVCVTLTEETTKATVARMGELASDADLFEVRADFLRDRDLGGILRARQKPILLTCRPVSEGGRWPDADPAGRRRILRQAVDLGFDMVDVEARAGFSDLVAAKAGRGLVLSWHDHEGAPPDLDALYARMAEARPDVVKIAVTARSVADLGRLVAFARRRATSTGANGARQPALVAIAMGPLGIASRILGGAWGAPFTFASAAAGREAAPGQPTLGALVRRYRVRSIGPATRIFGLVGADVGRSLSPAVHNAAFAARGIDAVFVLLQAESLEAFLEARPALGLSGFSLTRPYKSAILASLGSVEPAAGQSGSVNTVVVRDGALAGSSTDGEGVLASLRKRIDVAGRGVAIVGAGGAARAAAFALARAGARVSVVARRPEQAAEVAAAAGAAAAPLADLARLEWEVLVNATPVGSGAAPGQMPVPEDVLRPGTVVLDMVYEPRETPLLAAARARSCRTIEGVEMLVAQALKQFEAWTGTAAPESVMTEAAMAAIAERA